MVPFTLLARAFIKEEASELLLCGASVGVQHLPQRPAGGILEIVEHLLALAAPQPAFRAA
jgi:hypothetical protein